MCGPCYSKWRRGKIEVPGEPVRPINQTKEPRQRLIRTRQSFEHFLQEFDNTELKKFLSKENAASIYKRARVLMEKFLFDPGRIYAVLQRFHERALKSDKVLMEYMRIIAPERDATPPVQVVINAPNLNRDTNTKYDVEGNAIDVTDTGNASTK